MPDGGLTKIENDGFPNSSLGESPTDKSPIDLLYDWLVEFTDKIVVNHDDLEKILSTSSEILIITSLTTRGYSEVKNSDTIVVTRVGFSNGNIVAIIRPESDDILYKKSVNYGIKEVTTGIVIRFHEKHVNLAKDTLDPEFIISLDDSRVLAAVTDPELYSSDSGIRFIGTNKFGLTTISRWENEIGDSMLMTQDLKKVVDLKFRSDVLSDNMTVTDGKSKSNQISIPTIVVAISTLTLFGLLVISRGLSIGFQYYDHIGLIALIMLNMGLFYQGLNRRVKR